MGPMQPEGRSLPCFPPAPPTQDAEPLEWADLRLSGFALAGGAAAVVMQPSELDQWDP